MDCGVAVSTGVVLAVLEGTEVGASASVAAGCGVSVPCFAEEGVSVCSSSGVLVGATGVFTDGSGVLVRGICTGVFRGDSGALVGAICVSAGGRGVLVG